MVGSRLRRIWVYWACNSDTLRRFFDVAYCLFDFCAVYIEV